MKRTYIVLIAMLFSFLVWLPFGLKMKLPLWGMDFSLGNITLWQNYDGPNYLIVEKTWYDKEKIKQMFSVTEPAEYFPAHFPVYPAVIAIFDSFLKGPTAMLLATLLGTVLCFLMFYQYLREFKLSVNPFWMTIVFMILPARWLALRGIGSPEPWFIFFILASLYYFKKEKYLLAGLLGALATLTKSPGVILLAAYGIFALVQSIKVKKIQWKYWPLLIQLLAIAGLFWLYKIRTGDFLAYLHSGDNIHLFWPPFSAFAPKGQVWVGNFWLEDIIWTWLIFGVGIMKLKEKKLDIEYYFAGLFFLSTLFIAHRDISRYILPIAPLALIGWDNLIQKKEFKMIAYLLIIPILLFTWNFLLNNTAPIADWAPYL